MDIVTIYAQPDTTTPLRAFEGLFRSFKKYGFRECDKLTLIVPAGGPEFLAKMQSMVDLLGSGHVIVPVAYPSLRGANKTLAHYHNNIMCRVFEEYKVGDGKFLYIPFGCEPLENSWMKTIETVVNMHADKLFIGETRKNEGGFDYLSGACILDGAWMRKTSMWQQMNAKAYPFDRGARPMQGGLLSYPLPFSDLGITGVKEDVCFTEAKRRAAPEKKAEKLAVDVPDSVSEKIEEKVEEFIAPVVVPEPVVAPDVLGDAIAAVKGEGEAPTDVLVADFKEMHHASFKKKHGKEAYAKLKKSGGKVEVAPEKKEKPKGFSINAGASGEKRVDHSV